MVGGQAFAVGGVARIHGAGQAIIAVDRRAGEARSIVACVPLRAGVIVTAGLVAQRFMFTARLGGATVFCTRVIVVAIDGGLDARAVLAAPLLGAGFCFRAR